jgi:hypothetical protein
MYKVIVLKERFNGIDKGKLFNLQLFETCLSVWMRKRKALSKPPET